MSLPNSNTVKGNTVSDYRSKTVVGNIESPNKALRNTATGFKVTGNMLY
jgi:hypothetical protein